MVSEIFECPCPCCGFFTSGEDYFGSFNICGVCGWEDDPVQLANPTSEGGANQYSLDETQKWQLTRSQGELVGRDGLTKDRKWRPLRPSEIEKANQNKEQSHWLNKAIERYEESYWIANPIAKDVEAEIYILNEEQGGRRTPIASGYRPQFHYNDMDWVVSVNFEHVKKIYPGTNECVYMGFMSPAEHVDSIEIDMLFKLREGNRVVATGKIIRTIDLIFSAA